MIVLHMNIRLQPGPLVPSGCAARHCCRLFGFRTSGGSLLTSSSMMMASHSWCGQATGQIALGLTIGPTSTTSTTS
eukprot:3734825-Rhodomonas_salina.1